MLFSALDCREEIVILLVSNLVMAQLGHDAMGVWGCKVSGVSGTVVSGTRLTWS